MPKLVMPAMDSCGLILSFHPDCVICHSAPFHSRHPTTMKTLCLLLSSFVLLHSSLAQHPAADATGFVPLFNGNDLTGWKTTGNWLVEPDGSVSLHPREGEKGWQRYDAYISTEKQYADFTLDLEFKINAKGNSGVFMRVGDLKDHVKSGFEVQILDTYGLEKPGHHDCGGIVKGIGPSKNMVKPAGEWNRYTITVKGRSVKVIFNGEQVIDTSLDDINFKHLANAGHIAFQDEALRVWYRNVRIKELK